MSFKQGASQGGSSTTEGAESETVRPILRYVRAREGGATARNIYDVKGVPVMEVSGGGLLSVYDERGGWLKVDIPGGFPAWVFGRYLRATSTPDVFEVTENQILMRPTPGTGGYPLSERLQAGDRVTGIETESGASLNGIDLSRTWVKIWSPPGACVWVQESRTESLGADEDGAAMWRAAEAALLEAAIARGDTSAPVGAPASTAASGADPRATVAEGAAPVEPRPSVRDASLADPDRAREALAGARRLLSTEREKPVPDWGAVRQALEGVLALGPDPVTETATRNELEKVDLLAEVARLDGQLAMRDQQQREALLRRQEDVWSQIEANHPFYGRFEQRGVLERFRAASGDVSYRVVRAGQIQAELVSRAGRYDLDLFVGAEVGVRGEGLGNARHAPGVAQVDATRIEVLAAPRR
ncbi:hypothetical protein [Engelhardtia mirabilis]|uniref:hypothetical protein n=1 Tax=Engelhardtia mirabilis TaxID=2528011 RepID=UPI00119E9009